MTWQLVAAAALGLMLGAFLLALLLILSMWLAERHSPKYSDEPCLPAGACQRQQRCAMHDTAFEWVAKRAP